MLRDVDKPLGIAFDKVETLLFFLGDGVERGMILRQIDQLLIHDEAHKTKAVLGIVVVNIAIDTILVNALGEQLGDDEKDLRTCGGEDKASCISHHAAVDGDGEMLALIVKLAKLPHDAEDYFAGAAGLGVGDGELRRHIRVEVMVDQHNDTWSPEQGRFHLVNTARRVEIKTEHEVSYLQVQVAALAMLVVTDNFLCVGQPVEEVGKLIGHNDDGVLAHGTEKLRPCETRADGIAVRTAVAGDDDVLAGFNQCPEPTTLFWREDVDIHLEQFVRIDTLVDELLDAGYCALAVGGIGDAKPF